MSNQDETSGPTEEALDPREAARVEWILRFGAADTPVECSDPGALDQVDLERWSRGPVPAEVAAPIQAHLAACGYCTALAEEYRALALEKRRVRRRSLSLAATAVGLALAVAVGSWLRAPSGRAPPPYQIARLSGAKAAVMSTPQQALPEEPWAFAPTSQIRLIVAPVAEAEEPLPRPSAAAFVAEPGGRLTRVRARFTPRGDSRFNAFELAATGVELFGDRTAARLTLVLAFAADPSTLDRLEDRRVEDLRALGGVSVVAHEVRYESEPR